MATEKPGFQMSHHDWHSTGYVAQWIAKDVTRDDERRPLLRGMIEKAVFPRGTAIDVLDVGAGYGVLTEEVRKRFPAANVVLQDYSQPMLDRARERLGNGDGHLSYVLCDLLEPSWTEQVGGPFDLAVSAIVLHNLGDRAKIFASYRAIRGLLKPDGVFLNYDRFPGGVEPHLAALGEAGFADVAVTYEKAPIAVVVAGPRKS
jgi:ubiquinone/menaquinone biosynthesis C-methylase UbiE